MRGSQTEEAGEAERLDLRIHVFERATEDLRAHVDAERGLQDWPVTDFLRRGLRERHRQRSLSGALRRLLEDGVDHKVGRGLDRRGMCRAYARPLLGDLHVVAK